MRDKLKQSITECLNGIDQQHMDTQDGSGWWDLSTEAEFGKRKLAEVMEIIDNYFNEVRQ